MPQFFIGVDAGGTKTELLGVAGEASDHRTGPGVNLSRDGLGQSTAVLVGLIADALDAHAERPDGLCIGVAGAGREADREALAARLHEHLGARLGGPLHVVHDGVIALEGALGDGSGMMAIVGTGSLVLVRTDEGEVARAGGWGAPIGDPGSGTALGRAVFAAVAADFDGGEPTMLRHLIAERHGIETAHDLIAASSARDWQPQAFAPLAIEAATDHDWTSTRILKTEANALAQRAGWLATQTQPAVTPRVALVGGLTNEAYYRECVAEAFLRHLPRWRIVRPAERPVMGAVAIAQRVAASDAR